MSRRAEQMQDEKHMKSCYVFDIDGTLADCDESRASTEAWLERHVFTAPLYMRKAGDHRDDDILKVELLARVRADGFEPIMAFDDRSRVVKAWRAAGIPCAQVAEGDF